MKLLGIDHVALNVSDLDRAETFYTEVLGFEVTHRFSRGLRHLMLATGNAAIALFESPELDTRPALQHLSETGYLHLAFKADRKHFEAIVEELKRKNVVIDSGPVRRGDGESIYFNDPDFNHLEIHCSD
ncbi:MAG: VOC family protein [Nitrospinaceae bacterium]|nr:MAG: VOC family protein [Nitrospinaceae bacterium]